jgi:DNA polymerase I-like protein with 3'-5' exonuclease and polymerase domains
LIFAIPKDEEAELIGKLSDLMTTAVTLPVKLTVEAHMGRTWYDAKE